MIINVLTGMLLGVALWLGWITKSLAGIQAILWLVAIILPLATALAVFSRFRKGLFGYLAYIVVQSLQQVARPKLKRAVWRLAGVMVIALICWAITGSGYALGVFLYGVLLAVLMSYFLHGLTVFAQEDRRT